MSFFKRKESRKHRKTLIHVYTSCKQTAPFIDTEKVFRSGICICVTYVGSKTNNFVVKLVTELHKPTLSVGCDFHFPRIFCFLNSSRLACFDNIVISIQGLIDKTNLLHFLLLVLIFYQFSGFPLKIWLNFFQGCYIHETLFKNANLTKSVKNDLVSTSLRLQNHLTVGWTQRFHWIGHLSVCRNLWSVLGDPILFDDDYFWHTKHDASQSGIILLHFEYAFLILYFYKISLKRVIAMK